MGRMADPAADFAVSIAVPAGWAVGNEDQVEQAALGGLRQASVVVDIMSCSGVGSRVPPGRDVMTCRHDEGAKAYFPG
jgi:hypothetical protein